MKILVAGATGMTGRHVVNQLLQNGHQVRAIVRTPDKLDSEILSHRNLTVIKAAILDLTDEELQAHVMDCDAIVSCLGHVLSFKGMFGAPRNLCAEATRRLCNAIQIRPQSPPTKFILMNTVGVKNPHLNEPRTIVERLVLSLLHYTIPPQRDNELAAAYLIDEIGSINPQIEWSIVRPDSLINADISQYETAQSPSTGLFSGRPTARANVARFMVSLIEDEPVWHQWKFKMPVIMNAAA